MRAPTVIGTHFRKYGSISTVGTRKPDSQKLKTGSILNLDYFMFITYSGHGLNNIPIFKCYQSGFQTLSVQMA